MACCMAGAWQEKSSLECAVSRQGPRSLVQCVAQNPTPGHLSTAALGIVRAPRDQHRAIPKPGCLQDPVCSLPPLSADPCCTPKGLQGQTPHHTV